MEGLLRDCTIYVAKTKVLISCVNTAQLIIAFLFAYARIRFSHDVAEPSTVACPLRKKRSRDLSSCPAHSFVENNFPLPLIQE